MFFKDKRPTTENTQSVKPYHLKYNGQKGTAQVIGRIESEFVAIVVNNPAAGKVNRIMKVTERKFFSDFGGTCTQLDIESTDSVLKS